MSNVISKVKQHATGIMIGFLATLSILGIHAATSPKAEAQIHYFWTARNPVDQSLLFGVYGNNRDLIPGFDNVASLGNPSRQWHDLYLGGTMVVKPTVVNNSSVTLTTANSSVVFMENMSANRTVTLPSASVAGAGYTVRIIDATGNVGATTAIIVNSTAGNLNGASAFNMVNSTYEQGVFYSTGTDWVGVVSSKVTE